MRKLNRKPITDRHTSTTSDKNPTSAHCTCTIMCFTPLRRLAITPPLVKFLTWTVWCVLCWASATTWATITSHWVTSVDTIPVIAKSRNPSGGYLGQIVTYCIALNFRECLISWSLRKYFNENFWCAVCSVCMQRIREIISTNSSKTDILENLDPWKFSQIATFEDFVEIILQTRCTHAHRTPCVKNFRWNIFANSWKFTKFANLKTSENLVLYGIR